MNIFFVSSYCSESVFSKLFNSAIVKPQISIQKFFHLLVKGLIYNGCKIQTLSGLPITSSSHKKLFWKYKSEYVDRIFYYYIPVINIKFLRHLFLWLSSAYRTFRWCVKHDKKESVIVCDLMFLWVTMPAFIIGHLWGFKVCAIVADLPVMRNTHTTRGKNSFFQSLSNKMNTWYAMNFDCFLFFAENMNCKLNRKNKPYIVIEGLVDSNFQQNSNMINSTKSIMYSGGLYEKYGIRKLLNAFLKLEDDDCELWLYGAGEMEEDIKQIAKTNPKIKYFGVVPNKKL